MPARLVNDRLSRADPAAHRGDDGQRRGGHVAPERFGKGYAEGCRRKDTPRSSEVGRDDSFVEIPRSRRAIAEGASTQQRENCARDMVVPDLVRHALVALALVVIHAALELREPHSEFQRVGAALGFLVGRWMAQLCRTGAARADDCHNPQRYQREPCSNEPTSHGRFSVLVRSSLLARRESPSFFGGRPPSFPFSRDAFARAGLFVSPPSRPNSRITALTISGSTFSLAARRPVSLVIPVGSRASVR